MLIGDEERQQLEKLMDEIGKLVQQVAILKGPADSNHNEEPIVTCWGVAYEATSVSMEKSNEWSSGYFGPSHQAQATLRGLFAYGVTETSPVSAVGGIDD